MIHPFSSWYPIKPVLRALVEVLGPLGKFVGRLGVDPKHHQDNMETKKQHPDPSTSNHGSLGEGVWARKSTQTGTQKK